MTEHLKLPAELRARIQHEAMLRGKSMEQLAIDVLDERFPPESKEERKQSIQEMFDEWHAEDMAMTEEEMKENEQVLRNIDANRCSPRKLFEKYLKPKDAP